VGSYKKRGRRGIFTTTRIKATREWPARREQQSRRKKSEGKTREKRARTSNSKKRQKRRPNNNHPSQKKKLTKGISLQEGNQKPKLIHQGEVLNTDQKPPAKQREIARNRDADKGKNGDTRRGRRREGLEKGGDAISPHSPTRKGSIRGKQTGKRKGHRDWQGSNVPGQKKRGTRKKTQATSQE